MVPTSASGSPPDLKHLDLARGADTQTRALFGVSVRAPDPGVADDVAQLVVGGARAHRAAQVGPLRGEQTGEQAAIGGQARPRAVAAERLGHRGDEAHLAGTCLLYTSDAAD